MRQDASREERLRVFLSYASQDRPVAAAINSALLQEGHDVFFDRDDLPPGEVFHARIRRAIERSHVFVFLISEAAIDARSYSLTELEMAHQALAAHRGQLLPVLLAPIPFERLPAYARSVTVLATDGDITAGVLHAIERLERARRARRLRRAAIGSASVLLLAAAGWLGWSLREAPDELTGTDGAPAVRIPAGAFVMGDGDYAPRRETSVSAFYLDRHEVTTGRYAKFLAANAGLHAPDGWQDRPAGSEELPVVGVDWHDAADYCRWAGRRLPTEAEWEKAARGSDARRYPWGNEAPTLDRANFRNTSPAAYAGGLHRVGSHPSGRSPYGIDDLAGNVNEWVADWHAEALNARDTRDPKGPPSGSDRVIRGGGRFDDAERLLAVRRYHARPDTRSEDIGFRCAKDAE